MWAEIYDQLAELILANRTTLIFVPTRRMSERVAFALDRTPGRRHRDAAPRQPGARSTLRRREPLKNGELRAVVATASLELGIDIGTIDLVVQLGSPRSIATALQRIGRSGHWVGAMPRGKIFATTRDELLECAALVRACAAARWTRSTFRSRRSTFSRSRSWRRARRTSGRPTNSTRSSRTTYPYRDLPRIGFRRSRVAAGRRRRRRRADAAARSCTTIASTACCAPGAARASPRSPAAARFRTRPTITVVAEPDGHIVGTLDEDFAVETLAGDIFLLGTNSWKIRRVETGVVRVEDAHGAPPTIPFWNGEGLGRTIELSHEVSELRAAHRRARRRGCTALLRTNAALDIVRRGASRRLHSRRRRPAWASCRPTQPSSPSGSSTKAAACS